METFNVTGYTNKFRITKMNAIDVLAMKELLTNNESYEELKTFFETVLEKVEVECLDKWLPVKEKNRDIYYPANIEDNVVAIQSIIDYFINQFLKPLFMKSSESTLS